MRKSILPFLQVPQLSKSDLAYTTGDERLKPFYTYVPQLESFEQIIKEKEGKVYPRIDLVDALTRQYQNLPSQEIVNRNIEALGHDNAFTIVTAHQPSLFLGPLYFLYKALTAINLAEAVEDRTGGKQRIVPVFVLGSEDHDLEEVNKAHLFGKQIVWQPNESGPVGSMSAESLVSPLEELRAILGESDAGRALFERVEKCYHNAKTFAEATQALLHEFFGPYGLVVLNMNDAVLKRHFIPIIQAELMEQPAFRLVNETIGQLTELGFKAQAAPREINLFYLMPESRERIILEAGLYKVLNTNQVFSKEEILAELESHPERFSPNVVLRPLFQETILPNLAYVGGGGELAYWLERKSLFRHFEVQFPMLVRRHSMLWLDRDAGKKLSKLGFSPAQFFADSDALIRSFVEQNASGEVSLELEINELKKIFEQVATKAMAIDPTLEKSVLAESVKAVGGLEQWQGRLVRSEKQKHETTLNQLRALKEKLFPAGGLQERYDNFLPYVLKYGEGFIHTLKEHFAPFDPGFLVIEEGQ
ncbi:MAG: bacillithiol biosynthesis cysteine-adding enzyme BshC [Phycisphaerae bacterium]|nr:bacillithiol biosynthesis cysteine-adding enzyme BshC [Saprospiraceae bacterium]